MTEELPTWVNVRAEAAGDNDSAPAPRTASTKADLAAVFESLLVLFAADWRERRVVSARARRAKVRLFIISKPSWGVRRGPWAPAMVVGSRSRLRGPGFFVSTPGTHQDRVWFAHLCHRLG